MESVHAISVQDVATIITFIAPGYFATATYTLRFAKSERAFSKLIIESIAWSFPIVAITKLIWERGLGKQAVPPTDTLYVMLLLIFSFIAGLMFTELRIRWPIKNIALWLGLASPDEDFLRSHFDGMRKSASVAVELKSGKKFSGTPSQGSIHSKNGPRRYCFNYVVWYDKKKDAWIDNPQNESIVIDLSEVEYIVTPMHAEKLDKKKSWSKRFIAELKRQWQEFGALDN